MTDEVKEPIILKLDKATTIVDVAKFLECHQLFINTYEGKRVAIPYKDRLDMYLKLKAEGKN